MATEFLPFAKPWIDQAAVDEVVACIESGWLTTGPRVKQFEMLLQEYLQAPHALALISATAGLHLAFLGLHLQPGDEVITTPLTFVATLNTICLAGGKPVLVDVELDTYNIDVKRIEAAITPRTRAIAPVHYAGLAVDLDPLYALAKKYNLHVIEDAAHAIGAKYKGNMIGSFGDTQVFSFHPNKVITTGEGGCITTHHAAMAKYIQLQRFHGIDRDAFNRFSKEGSQHYDIIEPGFKYNMMDMQAALGIHQLALLEEIITRRTQLVTRYQTLLQDWPELTLPGTPNYDHRHAWYIFAPLLNPDVAHMNRDNFMQALKDEGIGTGLHYEAAHLYSYYRQTFGYKRGDFPNAETIGDRIFSLPLFPQMSEAEQDRVVAVMAKVLKKS